jgi:hypothetical protein
MDAHFEYITNLQYKVKTLSARLRAFETGEKYDTLKSAFDAQLAAKDREIKTLKNELAVAHRQTIIVRKNWMQVNEDLEKEHAKALEIKDRTIKSLKERALNAESLLAEQRAKHKETLKELYQVKTDLEDERGKVLSLNVKALVAGHEPQKDNQQPR